MKTLYPNRSGTEKPSEGLSIVQNVMPDTLIVSVEEMKSFARIDSSDDDQLVASLIRSGMILLESHTQTALIKREIIAYWRTFRDYAILPFPPFVSLTKVEEEDVEGGYDEIEADSYFVHGGGKSMRLYLQRSFTTVGYLECGVRTTYETGYADADNVPSPFKDGLKDIVASAYDRRGEGVSMTDWAKDLLSGFVQY